jgi:hypothetical protein
MRRQCVNGYSLLRVLFRVAKASLQDEALRSAVFGKLI